MKLPRDTREMFLNMVQEITAKWTPERKSREMGAIIEAMNDHSFFKRARSEG